MTTDFGGKYIHIDDLKTILANAGLSLDLSPQQPGTRRMIDVNGNPAGNSVNVTRDEVHHVLSVG